MGKRAKGIFFFVCIQFLVATAAPQPVQAESLSKKILIPCVLALSLFSTSCAHYREIGRSNGVQIVTPTHQDQISILLAGFKATELPKDEEADFLKAVKRFQAHYSSEFLKETLSEICIGNSCVDPLDGKSMGGGFNSSHPTRIVVSKANKSDYFGTLQHEFAHLLENKFGGKEFQAAWVQASQYTGETYSQYQAKRDSKGGRPSYYAQGFISSYGARNFDEDFAETAEALFSGKIPWPTLSEYPVLERKVELAIWFYHQLDDRFDLKYFHTLANYGQHGDPVPSEPEPSLWQKLKSAVGI